MSREFGTGASGTADFGAVDLDRLADFTAGALDRADAAEVAHLVASDARWATAHAALVRADALVRDDLRAASTATPMPADVVARLDDFLRAIGATAGAKSRDETPAVVSLDAARGRGTAQRRGTAQGRRTARAGGTARGRRRGSWAGLAAAAAAVVAVIGGITIANQLAAQDGTTTAGPGFNREETSDQAAAPGAPTAPTAAFAGTPSFVVSGSDYRPETLPQLARMPFFAGAPPSDTGQKEASADEVPQMIRKAAPGALSRLTDPVALRTCLDGIGAAHPGSVTLVDYARFRGEPALVVLVRQGTASTVVAVGPACGLAGTDEKAFAPVS